MEVININTDITARRAFWVSVINDENATLKERLKASELLSKSYGDFTPKGVLENAMQGLTAEQQTKIRGY